MAALHHWNDSSSGFRPGQVLADKYLLLEPLGIGGMGQVWTARNLATGAEVAIKMLLAARATSAVARFRREAYATAQLAHRGIVRIFDLVEVSDADGSVAMVMERLHGKTLAEHLEHNGPLTFEQTLGIVLPILSALHHAHGLGTIHRDLKPENIFLALEPDGALFPKLLDFGISKMLRTGGRPITGDGLIVGTPGHMSPEQVRGEDVDARSDVFCVGILLCMCLTGRNPFEPTDENMCAVTAVFATPPPPPADMEPALWQVIARALAPDPDGRFATAAELADALVALTGDAVEAGTNLSRASTTSITVTALHPIASRLRVAGVAIAACILALSFVAAGGSPRHAGFAAHPDEHPARSARTSPRSLLQGSVDVLVARRDVVVAHEAKAPARGAFLRVPAARGARLVLRDPGF